MSEELPSAAPANPPSSGSDAGGSPPQRPRRLARNFRWQHLFQRCADPLFVLNRRCRLLFVNRAWETLTGVSADEATVLVCRQPRMPAEDASRLDTLAHALTPPPEVLRGAGTRVRRKIVDRKDSLSASSWWEVEFLPLTQEGKQGGHHFLGRIRPVPAIEPSAGGSLSEKLVNLRQRRVERFEVEIWSSELPAMRRLREQMRLASQIAVPVLLLGESGSGKHTLARTIHHLSLRRDGACAALDCQHLPPSALSALLFGERTAARAGLAAVYLRGPEHLPRDVQLRLVEWIMRSTDPDSDGTTAPRLFAGCTVALAQLVHSGRMLEELACALGTLVLEVPPLRERLADLPNLIERLLERACSGRPVRITSLSADAWAVLRGYSWPGNLRELYTVLRSAVGHRLSAIGPEPVEAGDNRAMLRAADLPAELCRAVEREQTPPRPAERLLPLEQLLEEAERRLIQLALQRTRGHKARAARLLSIPRPRLWRRMIKLGIVDTEGDTGSPDEE